MSHSRNVSFTTEIVCQLVLPLDELYLPTNNVVIQIDEKENELLTLEEKLEFALIKIEKTVHINTEVSNCLSEKTLQLEEAVTTINEQKKISTSAAFQPHKA